MPTTATQNNNNNENKNPDVRQAFDGLKQSLKDTFKVARRFTRSANLKPRAPPSSYRPEIFDRPYTPSSLQPSTTSTAHSPFPSSDPESPASVPRQFNPTTSHASPRARAVVQNAHASSSAVTLPAPPPPILAFDVPMSNIQVDREVPWATRPYKEALRNQVDVLVVQQIHPAFAKMRAMEGGEDRGPFLVARGVSSQLYDAFRHLANVPYFTFEHDDTSQTVWYYGDPSEVHECFNAWFSVFFNDTLTKILRDAPLQPVLPEGVLLGDHRSLAVELYRSMYSEQSVDMDDEEDVEDEEDEENDPAVENEPEEKANELKDMLFLSSNSPAKSIEIPDEHISKKKEPDFLLQTSEPFSDIYCPKSLVALETAVWNETVSKLAEEVRVWKKNGSTISICFNIDRRGPLNGFDPLIYLFVAYTVVEEVDGAVATVTRHLQYNIGRLSGVKAKKSRCTTGDTRHGLARDRLDAINNGGRQDGAYKGVPGFTVISPTPRLIRIPLGSVLMEAFDSQDYGYESPALLEYFRQQELVIDASRIRSRIIRLCLAEEAAQRRTAAAGYADFIDTQKLAGMSDAEAQRAWTLHLVELEAARAVEGAATRLARVQEVAADAEPAARPRRRGPAVRGQASVPAPAPARRTMITRLMRRLNPER